MQQNDAKDSLKKQIIELEKLDGRSVAYVEVPHKPYMQKVHKVLNNFLLEQKNFFEGVNSSIFWSIPIAWIQNSIQHLNKQIIELEKHEVGRSLAYSPTHDRALWVAKVGNTTS